MSIKNYLGGYINKCQTNYDKVEENIKSIKNINDDIYNDDDSSFYSAPLIDKVEILCILDIIKHNMELEKKELDKALEFDAEYIASNINPLFEKVKEINSLNIQINELKKVQKKEKAIENLNKKKIKLVQELNSINGEENNDEAIQQIFNTIPKDYKDLNIQECEREKEKKETKINLINKKIVKLQENITSIQKSKDQSFSKENIHNDYRFEYNEIKKERNKMIPDYNKNTLSFYNTVFNNIVPIYFDLQIPGKFFDFLKGRNNEQFIVCKLNDNNSYFYEIYRSSEPRSRTKHSSSTPEPS
jgi:hypothetical protein